MVGQNDGGFARTQGFDDLLNALNTGRCGFTFTAYAPRLHDFIHRFELRRFVHRRKWKRKLLADIPSGKVVAADVWGNKQQSFARIQRSLYMFPSAYFYKQFFYAFRSSEKSHGQFQPAFDRFAEHSLDRRFIGLQTGRPHIVKYAFAILTAQIINRAAQHARQCVQQAQRHGGEEFEEKGNQNIHKGIPKKGGRIV